MKGFEFSINHLSINVLNPSLGSNEVLEEMLTAVTQRKYYTKQLGIDRGTFHHWNRKGLIPYSREGNKGWQKFSFIECVWLGVLKDLRELGVSLEFIKNIKDTVFENGYGWYLEEMKKGFANMVEFQTTEEREVLLTVQKKYADITAEEVKLEMQQSQQSFFLALVLQSLCSKQKHFITISKKGIIGLYADSVEDLFMEGNKRVKTKQVLSDQSHVQINIWNVICELLQLQAIVIPSDVLAETLTEEEKQIIAFVRDKEIAEIQIEKGIDGLPSIIRISREQINDSILKKLYPFLKKGEFIDWSFSNRNGKLIKYSEKEIIKLSKSK